MSPFEGYLMWVDYSLQYPAGWDGPIRVMSYNEDGSLKSITTIPEGNQPQMGFSHTFILATGYFEEKAVEFINNWLKENEAQKLKNWDRTFKEYPGTCGGIYIGNFYNFCDKDDLVEVIWSAPWKDPEEVQFMWKYEEDERYTILTHPKVTGTS